MKDYKEVGTCCLCGNQYSHWGNNPFPLSTNPKNRCCDKCYAKDETKREKSFKQTYNADDKMYEFYKIIWNNLNDEKGYEAYYNLTKYIKDNNKDNSCLYDLAASFKWDETLGNEFDKLAVADNRLDLIQ